MFAMDDIPDEHSYHMETKWNIAIMRGSELGGNSEPTAPSLATC
jgi:hypothetical protein